ncbi:MAG: PrsW family intramembrane metalloprotease [Clostridia bacterium]|nr:PrsW family intramembrane metalloprotease [Clostridia bacterium]
MPPFAFFLHNKQVCAKIKAKERDFLTLIIIYVLVYVFAALLPSFFLLRYIYKHDTVEKEPPKLLWKLFFLGVLSAIPACIMELIGGNVLDMFVEPDNPVYSIVTAFLVVAVVEEGFKFFFLKRATWNNPNFNYRFDGVVYAVFVSLGFAAIENILYVFSYGLSVALPRALLAVPAHMGFAVFMGAFYGNAQLWRAKGKRAGMYANLIMSYLLPVLLHGIYDACAMVNSTYSALAFYGFVIVMYFIVIRTIKKASAKDELI